jgi:hypothetical protein
MSQSRLEIYKPYKIFQLKNETDIERIIVFYGDTRIDDLDLNEVYQRDRNSNIIQKIIQDIFSDSEKKIMSLAVKDINIYFSRQQIHLDDTISDIKLKITYAINELLSQLISYDEIYIYCQKLQKINIVRLYQTLTNHKRLSITRTRLDNCLSNIILNREKEKVIFDIEYKTEYDYDDIISLNIEEQYFY